jgi:hypothetical protein
MAESNGTGSNIQHGMTAGRIRYLAKEHWKCRLEEIPSPTKQIVHTQYFGTKQLSWMPSMTEVELENIHISPDPRMVRIDGFCFRTDPEDSDDCCSPVMYTELAKLPSNSQVSERNHPHICEPTAMQKVSSDIFIEDDSPRSHSCPSVVPSLPK